MSTAAPNPSEPVFSATVSSLATDSAADSAADPLLPDDPEVLKQMIRELLETLRSARHEQEHLQQRIDQLLRRLYGPRAERFNPNQPLLFPDEPTPAEPVPEPPPLPPVDTASETTIKKRPGHGRQQLPKHLERRRVVHDLTAVERTCCGCGQERAKIGEDISEQLEYVPASLFIRVHVRPKYACPRCRTGVFSATVAAQPIDKGLPGPGLLAYIIVCKFADHLPLYRQETIFSRQRVHLSRQTLCDWLGQAGALLKPLYERLKIWVLGSQWLHTDDTRVQVQDIGKTRTARFWGYLGDDDHPGNVFDYTPNRKRDGPREFLKGFQGFLHADAFSGYDCIYAGDRVTEVGCNAHARRKFYDARSSAAAAAHTALGYYRQLFKIEAEAKAAAAERYVADFPEAPPLDKGLPPERFLTLLYEERLRRRQQESVPILAEFERWLREQKTKVLSKSPLAEAITYALNQWQALTRYTTAGFLDIDNNWAEREMRRLAIGRKNWLFVGNDEAGRTAAIFVSFVSTCQRHDIDSFAYLQDILRRLPEHPADRLDELLPGRWRPLPPPVDAHTPSLPPLPSPATETPTTLEQ